MELVKIVFVFLTACAVNVKQTCGFRVDTMDTVQNVINLKDPSYAFYASGILKSHSGFEYTINRNKTVVLSAPKGYSLFAAVRLLDLRPNNEDYLTLFANDTAGPVTFSNSLWYQKKYFDLFENNKTYYAPDGQLGVTFYAGPSFTNYGYMGFEIIYTVQANRTKCHYDDFHCANSRCVSLSFKCDGHNHCGDRSDQSHCYFPEPIPTPGGGRVVGIVAGVVFLLIAAACVIYIMIKRVSRMKTRRDMIINQHPPPSSIEGYPPPYSESGVVYPPPPPYSPYPGIVNPGYQ